MYIKRADAADLCDILALQYEAYQSEAKLLNNPDIPPLKQTLDELAGEYEKGVILKAVDENGCIIGSVRGCEKDDTVYVGKLMVHPDYRGQGIGTGLLRAMENEFPNRRFELFTGTKSERNIALYKRLGYSVFDERKVTDALSFVYLEKF